MKGKNYKRLLLAIDFFEGNDVVINQAKDLAELYQAELFLLHVSEPLTTPVYGFGASLWNTQTYEIQAQVEAHNKVLLEALGKDLGLAEDNVVMLIGRPSSRIHDFCDEQAIDLVVMGTHGQHGLELLLGSTANSVLHGSKCDVLAVRISEPS